MDIPGNFGMVGDSPAFMIFWRSLQRYSAHNATVLISGETGAGKELAARALHYLGERSGGPFLPVNCGAVPDSLLESEFFGYLRGAFTDARTPQVGIVEQAQGGTLFLDEVEALSQRGQSVLLRFLQDFHYRPLGARAERIADVRVVAATNVNLDLLVKQRGFRVDLMHRLKTLVLDVPPLRERLSDIELIADAILDHWSEKTKQPRKRLSRSAMILLEAYDWPGNVRELENVLLNGVIATDEQEINESHLHRIAPHAGIFGESRVESYATAKERALETFERNYLTELMRRTNGNITKAAMISRQHRTALSKLLKRYEIPRE